MDTTCAITFPPDQASTGERQAKLAADQLGALLFDTPEFQSYMRLLQAANHDEEVVELTYQIRDLENNYCCNEGDQPDIDDLYAQLEALPTILALREAEKAIRRLFMQVDALVSAAVQAPFAHYARAGCA